MSGHKLKAGILALILTIMIIAGNKLVSSQVNENRAETTSPSGLKQPPDNVKRPASAIEQPANSNQKPLQDIPDEVTYGQMYRHIEELHKKADDSDRANRKDGKKFRDLYKDMARLDERKARALDRHADETNRELKKLDDRAKQIIDQLRSQTPNRRIEKGQKPPVPPRELFDLAKRRKDIILQSVSDLRKEFGEAEFVRFSQFVNEKVKPGIKKQGSGAAKQNGGINR